MRLLEISPGGRCTLTRDLDHDKVPPYAILSHTWQHGQEVTYEDIVCADDDDASSSSSAPSLLLLKATGWRKINFCVAQASRDGLRHCWIDSCCIDKGRPEEKHGAFNSMFAWYQRARVCYVYLHDVLGLDDLSASRWWTRGWTLQELLAPAKVVFFSCQGQRLGDKRSLEHLIHLITSIRKEALRGQLPLSRFSIEEKLSWMKGRQTTFEEDWAYCLQGILGFEMSRRYGEGRRRAIERLKKEAERREEERIRAEREQSLEKMRLELEREQRSEHLYKFAPDLAGLKELHRRLVEEALEKKRMMKEEEEEEEQQVKQKLGLAAERPPRTEAAVSPALPERSCSAIIVEVDGGDDLSEIHSRLRQKTPAFPPRNSSELLPAGQGHTEPVYEWVRKKHAQSSKPPRKNAQNAMSPPGRSSALDYDPAMVEVTLEDLLAVGGAADPGRYSGEASTDDQRIYDTAQDPSQYEADLSRLGRTETEEDAIVVYVSRSPPSIEDEREKGKQKEIGKEKEKDQERKKGKGKERERERGRVPEKDKQKGKGKARKKEKGEENKKGKAKAKDDDKSDTRRFSSR